MDITVDEEAKDEMYQRGLKEAIDTIAQLIPRRLHEEDFRYYKFSRRDAQQAAFEYNKILNPRAVDWTNRRWNAYEQLEEKFKEGYNDGLKAIYQAWPGADAPALQKRLSQIARPGSPEKIKQFIRNEYSY